MNPERCWETFLRVGPRSCSDEAPLFDAKWLLARGVEEEAPTVLYQISDKVLPLVRRLERDGLIDWFCFLVHDASSGVPVVSECRDIFIHLRVSITLGEDVNLISVLPPEWTMTRWAPLPRDIAGIVPSIIKVDRAWQLLGEQSSWFLKLVESISDPGSQVPCVRQFLHFFANMAQMRVA